MAHDIATPPASTQVPVISADNNNVSAPVNLKGGGRAYAGYVSSAIVVIFLVYVLSIGPVLGYYQSHSYLLISQFFSRWSKCPAALS
ncbi:MAG TPA: hypothetical protein VK970_14030 [Candidatus Methylacidiphilales bacterium]|nr:hypothetical protein [Candidatus Methylacidiphilales bacterium]